ncbi:MAG: GMC family oxidoreductase [Bryobacterales bacterium]|nr:GMC family oxidoreductase [Bryobacterales bacterium]
MFQVRRSAPVHDVVVIGSGAGGGTVVQVLTQLGVKVTLLEAGPMLNPAKDFKEHMWPYQVPHRGAGADAEQYFGRKNWGFWNAPNCAWEINGEPYTVAPGSNFQWHRSRILGGRTNHYGRITLRFSDYDFKPYSFDGLGTDWPVTYDEIAPYYDRAERFIGVCGTAEGIRSAPDGQFLPVPEARIHERMLQKAAGGLGIKVIPSRMSILTKPLNGRPACHYCGQCGRGCTTASNYSSSQVQILPALKSGKLNIIPNAMAREILTDATGKASGVDYIDTQTRQMHRIRARVVVVACGACESARLLLNSKSSRHPNGLANGSGVVGRYLTDTVGYGLSGYVPALEGMPKYNTDGYSGGHLYIPWWELDKKNKDFPRGYHVEIGGGYGMPLVGSFHGISRRVEGFGADLKNNILKEYGCIVGLSGRGEMIPNEHSFCELDPTVTDRFGIPVLRFHFRWSENEIKQAKHMHKTFVDIIEAMGGRVMGLRNPEREDGGISIPGSIIHELGTVRMGDDPNKSALNKWEQAHEVKNLFVCDAAPFVSNPDKNPTLSINAFAWRASDYMADLMKKGDL